MVQVEVELKNETGLHARPAHLFVEEASKYDSEITLVKDGEEYDAKSIISILTMEAFQGDKFTIKADGQDEKDAVTALESLVSRNFDE